jgi:ATP-binding protein involved in chromosome partitioning
VQSICESGDAGVPVAQNEDSVTGRAFLQLAASVVRQVDKRNVELAPTEVVKMNH